MECLADPGPASPRMGAGGAPDAPPSRPPGPPPEPLPAVSGSRIEEVRDPDGLRDWEQVAVDGFPLPELADTPLPTMVGEGALADGSLRLWVGYAEGRPVSIGSVFVACGVANPVLAVTLPEARRRGFAFAIGARALATAPGVPVVTLGSDLGRPTMEAGGFLPICRFTAWHRKR